MNTRLRCVAGSALLASASDQHAAASAGASHACGQSARQRGSSDRDLTPASMPRPRPARQPIQAVSNALSQTTCPKRQPPLTAPNTRRSPRSDLSQTPGPRRQV